MELRRTRRRERERGRRSALAHEEREAREQEEQHKEIVPSFHDEREELRVERDRRGHRKARCSSANKVRDQGEGADVRREIEVPLVPDEAEVIEEPNEWCAHQEHEREVGEVVKRRVVDHRPEEHRSVEVVGDVGVHAGKEFSRSFLNHERAVVDVRVGLTGLAKDDRRERRNDHERRDHRGEVRDPRACCKGPARAMVAQRIRER